MTDVTVTIPSNRIYMDTLLPGYQSALMQHRRVYSAAKERLYNVRYDQAFLSEAEKKQRGTPERGKDTACIKDWIFEKFGLRPQEYHITSLFSQADGMLSSQKELLKLRDAERKARIENRADKIRSTEKNLKALTTIKKKLVERSKAVKAGRKAPKVGIPAPHMKKFPELKTDEQYYLYEVWLDGKIKSLRNRLTLLNEKQKREQAEDNKVPNRIIFGGRKFYKSKDTTDISRDEWHRQREHARTHMLLFSGRYDSKNKNWLCSYDATEKLFSMSLIDGMVVKLEDVEFPYRGDDLMRVLSHGKESGWSVGYWLDFRTDHKGREYFLVKASFSLHDDHMNEDTSTGVVSIDLNADNVSWAELDAHGCRLDGGMIRFDLRGKSSNRITDILGRVSAEVIEICRQKKKPLAMENIDTSLARNRMQYGSRKANAIASMFSYRKLTELLKSRTFRHGIGIIFVNPAYTSQIGKIKYMMHYRMPVHMAAAYVIGRRAMGLSEKMPSYLRQLIPDEKLHCHHWKQFAHLYVACKKIPADTFLKKLPVFGNMKQLTGLQPSFA